MNFRTVCICIVAIVAVLAVIILLYSVRSAPYATGAVSTEICPRESAPVISGERFLAELNDFERRGYTCFFGYDGITPCCVRRGA